MRTPDEFAAGRLAGFRSAPGGQLVQETEQFAPVRGARFVLADTDGVRANMTGSWLRQMNQEVHVIDQLDAAAFTVSGAWSAPLPPLPSAGEIDVPGLAAWLAEDAVATLVLDVGSSAGYARGHGREPGSRCAPTWRQPWPPCRPGRNAMS